VGLLGYLPPIVARIQLDGAMGSAWVVGHPLPQRREGRGTVTNEALEEERRRGQLGGAAGIRVGNVPVVSRRADEDRRKVELLARGEGGQVVRPYRARQRPLLHRLRARSLGLAPLGLLRPEELHYDAKRAARAPGKETPTVLEL